MSAPVPLKSSPRLGDWLEVDDSGAVTMFSGRVELGQGALTAIRAMAAAELCCAPESIRIQPARTDRSPDEGLTAGSMSIPIGGMAMRWAASALRVQLLVLAAEKFGCAIDELELSEGSVLRNGKPSGETVASLAAGLDFNRPVTEDASPLSSELRQQVQPRRAGLEDLLTGAPYLHDLSPEGLLFGRPIHPPTMSARLSDIDLDGLRERPGVVAVVHDGDYLGVVAESEYAALRAARWARANASWKETATAPNDVMQMVAASEEPASTTIDTGDVDASQGVPYETTISRPFLFHGSIGPSAALAEWRDGDLTLHTASQGVYSLRAALAKVFETEAENLTLIHHPGAGCYGHNGADDAAFDAAFLARAVPGRPVRVVWGREDEFRSAPMGPAMVTRAVARIGEDGRIQSMAVDVNSAPHANRPGFNGAPNLRGAMHLAKPYPLGPAGDLPLERGGAADRNAIPYYAIPNVRVTKRLVQSTPYRSSSLRGLGTYANIYAIETLMDKIARERGEDPVDFRLRHLEDARARNVLEAAALDAAAFRNPGEGAGWGIAFSRYKNAAGYCAVAARVEVDEFVRVTHLWAAADIGEVVDPDGARNQIEGGMIQATSWTLKEAVPFEGVQVAAETWDDYPILRFSEVPETHVRLFDRPADPPLGCGEISQGPTGAAIGNAVRDAIGVEVPDLPLSREHIIAAVG